MKKILEQFKQLLKNPLYIKYQYLILPGASLIICLGLVALFIIPQTQSWFKSQEEISEIEQKIDFFETKKDTLSQVDTQTYQKNLEIALTAIPEDKEIPDAVDKVFLLVNSSGMQLTNITFGNVDGSQASGLGSFAIKVELAGSADKLKKFFELTKEVPRLIRVNGLEVTGSGEFNKITAAVELLAYFEPLPNNLGSVDSEVSLLSPTQLEVLENIKSHTSNIPQSSAAAITTPSSFKNDPFQ